TMTGYRQHKPKNGLTKCPDLVDHYRELRARTSLARFMPREKIRPDSQFCRALLAIGLTSP
ncbi:hypothetical protein, partial [Aeromonas veronii]